MWYCGVWSVWVVGYAQLRVVCVRLRVYVWAHTWCLDAGVGCVCCFFFQAEDGIRDRDVTGVQTCALPISFLPTHGALVRSPDSCARPRHSARRAAWPCSPAHRSSAAAPFAEPGAPSPASAIAAASLPCAW